MSLQSTSSNSHPDRTTTPTTFDAALKFLDLFPFRKFDATLIQFLREIFSPLSSTPTIDNHSTDSFEVSSYFECEFPYVFKLITQSTNLLIRMDSFRNFFCNPPLNFKFPNPSIKLLNCNTPVKYTHESGKSSGIDSKMDTNDIEMGDSKTETIESIFGVGAVNPTLNNDVNGNNNNLLNGYSSVISELENDGMKLNVTILTSGFYVVYEPPECFYHASVLPQDMTRAFYSFSNVKNLALRQVETVSLIYFVGLILKYPTLYPSGFEKISNWLKAMNVDTTRLSQFSYNQLPADVMFADLKNELNYDTANHVIDIPIKCSYPIILSTPWKENLEVCFNLITLPSHYNKPLSGITTGQALRPFARFFWLLTPIYLNSESLPNLSFYPYGDFHRAVDIKIHFVGKFQIPYDILKTLVEFHLRWFSHEVLSWNWNEGGDNPENEVDRLKDLEIFDVEMEPLKPDVLKSPAEYIDEIYNKENEERVQNAVEDFINYLISPRSNDNANMFKRYLIAPAKNPHFVSPPPLSSYIDFVRDKKIPNLNDYDISHPFCSIEWDAIVEAANPFVPLIKIAPELFDNNIENDLISPDNSVEYVSKYHHKWYECFSMLKNRIVANCVTFNTYAVESLDMSKTPLFPGKDSNPGLSLAESWKQSRKVKVSNLQPIFNAVPCESRCKHSFVIVKKGSNKLIAKLIPEMLVVLSLRSDLMNLIAFVPSILWQIERHLLPLELASTLRLSKKLSLTYWLESLTTPSVNLSYDYQRCEYIGDMLLKLAISVTMFFQCPEFSEKDLTQNRCLFINNALLAVLSLKANLPQYSMCTRLFPRSWVRPHLYNESERVFNEWHGFRNTIWTNISRIAKNDSSNFSIKMVADLSESTLGAYGSSFQDPYRIPMILDFLKIVFHYDTLTLYKMEAWVKDETIPEIIRKSLDKIITSFTNMNETTSYWRNNTLDFNWQSLFAKFMKDHSHNVNDARTSKLLGRHIFVQSTLLYNFRNPALLINAIDLDLPRGPLHYQRLEYLGDVIIDYLVSYYIYNMFPKKDPGKLTSLRSKLVCNDNFSNIFDTSSFCGDQDVSIWIAGLSPKQKADTVENLVGALWLDLDMNFGNTWKVLRPWILPTDEVLIKIANSV